MQWNIGCTDELKIFILIKKKQSKDVNQLKH